VQNSPNFQALFQDLPDLTPPRKKLSSTFTGQSPSSGGEFGFPRLIEGSPDRQRLGLEFLQRSTPLQIVQSPPGFVSPRSGLGMPPPLPIFQPSPIRGSQMSTYLSPDSKEKRRMSDVSEFQRFSMSPNFHLGNNNNGGVSIGSGEGKHCLTSAFADILDGHSRVSPKSLGLHGEPVDHKSPPAASWKGDMVPQGMTNASNSPLQLDNGSDYNIRKRKRSIDFSDVKLSPVKQENTKMRSYPASPSQTTGSGFRPLEDGGIDLLPIHPLNSSSREVSPDKKHPQNDVPGVNGELGHRRAGSMDTLAQSPMGLRMGVIRREDIIDSPAVKEATEAAVAAAMRANAEVSSFKTAPSRRPQRAAAAGVAAAAAAAAIGTNGSVKGRRSNVPSKELRDRVGSLFAPTSIPGMIEDEPVRCKCRKSKCLKLYCECFKAKGYCGDDCSCVGCSNKPGLDDEIGKAREAILSRNPHAFSEKISEMMVPSRHGMVATGAQHRRGCNCKKSKCQKKYCECFQAGIPCGEHCKCDGCANTSHSHVHALGQGMDSRDSIDTTLMRGPHQYKVSDIHPMSLKTGKNSLNFSRHQIPNNAQSLVPLGWTPMHDVSSDAGIIEGLTPIAPGNLQLKTEGDM
jgi:hypothetical protein